VLKVPPARDEDDPDWSFTSVILGVLLLLALWAFPLARRRGRAYGDDD
jgi:MYXO-CTERM domain-containing protein